jgi:hypothetical protein
MKFVKDVIKKLSRSLKYGIITTDDLDERVKALTFGQVRYKVKS